MGGVKKGNLEIIGKKFQQVQSAATGAKFELRSRSSPDREISRYGDVVMEITNRNLLTAGTQYRTDKSGFRC